MGFILFLIYSIFISFFLIIFVGVLKDGSFNYYWKVSSFECGFEIFSPGRQSFSIQFFLIGLLFLLFDVEVSFLVPMFSSTVWWSWFEMIILLCVLVLLIGLGFEWEENKLEWSQLEKV